MKNILIIYFLIISLVSSVYAEEKTFLSISIGEDHTVGITADGKLWAWGDNTYGQLGDGTIISTHIPKQIGTDTNWKCAVAGWVHTIAIKTDGTLWAWGNNTSGQVGDGTNDDKLTPTQIGTDTTWSSIAVGKWHSVALKTDGTNVTLWAWGNNMDSQLGDNSTVNQTIPTQIGTDTDWKTITANETHTLAIKTDGTLWGWGRNSYAQLGDSDTADKPIPTQIGTDADWDRVATGSEHTLAIKFDHTLWAWGSNNAGQLGDGSNTNRTTPIQIGDNTDWISVSAYDYQSGAIKSDDTLWLWGNNGSGELGDGTTVTKFIPTMIGNNLKFKSISLSVSSSLAIETNGSLWAWGNDDNGELGDGTHTLSPTKIVTTFIPSKVVSSATTAIIDSENKLWAWGDNGSYNLGLDESDYHKTPVQLNTSTTWSDVSVGENHLLAVNNGELWAWGDDRKGQIGDGGTSTVTVHTKIGTDTTWLKVSAGYMYSVALKTDGTLWAWGYNLYGQLGDNSTTNVSTPTQIGSDTWAYVVAGDYHTVAIKTDGTLWAWGYNSDGQLGDGTTDNKLIPTQIGQDTTWTKIEVRHNHTLGLKSDGTLWSWGFINNTTGSLKVPTQIGSDTNWSDIASGSYHSLALKSDGTLWSWGGNMYGALGNDTEDTDNATPTQIGSDTNWVKISAGKYNSMALKEDTSTYVWGRNDKGQLGNLVLSPRLIYENTPLQPELTLKAHGGVIQLSDSNVSLNKDFSLSDFSFETWINTSSPSTSIITFDDFENNGEAGYIGVYNGKLNVSSDVEGATDAYATSDINDSAWHHVAVTYNNDLEYLSIYVDGDLEYAAVDDLVTTTGSVMLGDNYNNSMQLDEVRLWNYQRTQSEIKATMNQQLSGDETGLVAYYNFDERVGNLVYDITSNNNDGNIEGNTTRLNFLGDTLSFNGLDDKIDISSYNDVNLSDTNITVLAWVKAQTSQNEATSYIVNHENSSLKGYALSLDGDGISFAIFNNDSGTTTVTANSNLLDNNWHYITGQFDGTNLKVYIDGDEKNTTVVNQDSIPNFSDGTLKIATSYQNSSDFNGTISEVSIFDEALTIDKIQKTMHSSLKGDEVGLAGYWPLNEGNATIAYDKSANTNNGTIIGATWIDTAPTIYGNTIYTSQDIAIVQKLVVENNTSTPSYSYNGTPPTTIKDFNGTSGSFLYDSNIAGDEVLDINAVDGSTTLNNQFKVVTFPNYIDLTLTLQNVYLAEFNIGSIRAYTSDDTTENLFVYDSEGRGGYNTIIDEAENSFSVPIFHPDNNFTIEVNQTFSHTTAQASWYYNFDDKKLYPDINSTTQFKTDINSTNNSFTMSMSDRVYYSFDGNISNNDNNVTSIIFMSNDLSFGYGATVDGNNSYSVQYSELGEHYIMLKVGDSPDLWYYNITNGEISKTPNGTTIDTNSIKSFNLNLSSSNFIITTAAPSISHIYDKFRTPNFTPFDITFNVDDSDSSSLSLSVNTDSDDVITTSLSNSTPSSGDSVTLYIDPITDASGEVRVSLILSDSTNVTIKVFSIKVANEFEAISHKESSVGSLDTSFTGDLYSFFSRFERVQLSRYEKYAIDNGVLNDSLVLEDINQTVELLDEELPKDFQYSDTNITKDDLIATYSGYGTPFTFTNSYSSGRKVYMRYTAGMIEPFDVILKNDGTTTFSSLRDFLSSVVEGVTTHGIRNNAKDKFLVFDKSDSGFPNIDTGNLVEYDEDGTATANTSAGSWVLDNTLNILHIYPDETIANTNGYKMDMAFILVDGYVTAASYKAPNDIYSYILLNKEAKDEIYHSVSPNPKIAYPIVTGYNYVSLHNTKSLCDADANISTTNICDQNNTLESVFSSNSAVDGLFKYAIDWQYWDSSSSINSSYLMDKFLSINPLDGIIVKATADTTLYIPYAQSDSVNNYNGMVSQEWYLLSNRKDQTISEIVAATTLQIEYILVSRNGTWYIYAPTNDSSIDPAIPRVTEIRRDESYWIIFQ